MWRGDLAGGTVHAGRTWENFGETWTVITVTQGPSPVTQGRGSRLLAPRESVTSSAWPVRAQGCGHKAHRSCAKLSRRVAACSSRCCAAAAAT